MTLWTCAKCGTSIGGDRSICRSCGSARRSAVDAAAASQPPPATTAASVPGDLAEAPDAPDSDDASTTAAPPWTCGKCRTVVEGDFEVCWQCGTSRTGDADPGFRPIDEVASASRGSMPYPDLGPDERVPQPPGLPPTRTCPACGTALVPIRLIDASGEYGLRHNELSYSAGDARPGWFSGFPMAGIVGAQLCPRCGRIDLYAVPTA